MKRFWMALIFLALAPLSSQAEIATVGGRGLMYHAPEGYVMAAEGKYAEALSFLKKAMPEDVVVHAVYVEKNTDESYGKTPDQMLDDYIVVTSNLKVDSYMISQTDFAKLKDKITQVQDTQLTTSVRDRSNKRLDEVTDGTVKIGRVRPMGIVESTDTRVSFMAVMTQSANINGALITFDQAFLSMTLLAESKVLSINHYRTVKTDEDIARFKAESTAAIGSMRFKEGAVAGVTDSLPVSESRKNKLSNTLTWAIIGGVIGAAIYFFRRRKSQGQPPALPGMPGKKTPPPPGSQPPPAGNSSHPSTSVKIGEKLEKNDNDRFGKQE
ncbi:hypothetical protein LJC19_08125 [Oxalobacter sp. OttesenSCG-928-P03]|nr:hypothetical protein [Oxalobacter sp. OttesenSCG-928-P03]